MNIKYGRAKIFLSFSLVLALLTLFGSQKVYAGSQTFTTTGTFTAPADVWQVTVKAWGGGGAGGGGTTASSSAGGGGGGGEFRQSTVLVNPGSSYSVVVGLGGAGAKAVGPSGSASTFNITSVVANGGTGGNTAASGGGTGGAGGSGGTGTTGYDGGAGYKGSSNGPGGGGGEGAGSSTAGTTAVSSAGASGVADGGDGGNGGATGGVGTAGGTPGGGGGGGGTRSGGATTAGDGARGEVQLTWNVNTLPSVTLNTINGTSSSDTTPTLQFTGIDSENNNIEYNVQIDTSSGFDSTSLGTSLQYIDIYMRKWGSPTDNLISEVRSNSIDGTTLGTSDSVPGTSLNTSLSYIRFTFTPITLSASTQYYFMVKRTGARDYTNNWYQFGVSASDVYSGGSRYLNHTNVWTEYSTDVNFKVFDTNSSAVVIQDIGTSEVDLLGGSATPGTFMEFGQSFTVSLTSPLLDINSVSGSGFDDGHPFTSGSAVNYTVQDALSAPGTYYWRVRGKDDSGANTYGSWSDIYTLVITEASPPASNQLFYLSQLLLQGIFMY